MPDLVVEDISFNPSAPRAGQQLTITCRYGNVGGGGTVEGFAVRLTLDGFTTLDAVGSPLAAGSND